MEAADYDMLGFAQTQTIPKVLEGRHGSKYQRLQSRIPNLIPCAVSMSCIVAEKLMFAPLLVPAELSVCYQLLENKSDETCRVCGGTGLS